jgi:hypothetical protein
MLSASICLAVPVNYDEAKVGEYTLPELLKQNDGKPVTTPQQWSRRCQNRSRTGSAQSTGAGSAG